MRLRPTLLLPLLLCCCTQNQLILDPFNEGESLIIEDDEIIMEFEQLMSDVATPENEYREGRNDATFFNSEDVLSTFLDTKPTLGICRSGDKEYYYHIEQGRDGTLISNLDMGLTDYVITPQKYEQITDFIHLHTPVPADYTPESASPGGEETEDENETEDESDAGQEEQEDAEA